MLTSSPHSSASSCREGRGGQSGNKMTGALIVAPGSDNLEFTASPCFAFFLLLCGERAELMLSTDTNTAFVWREGNSNKGNMWPCKGNIVQAGLRKAWFLQCWRGTANCLKCTNAHSLRLSFWLTKIIKAKESSLTALWIID